MSAKLEKGQIYYNDSYQYYFLIYDVEEVDMINIYYCKTSEVLNPCNSEVMKMFITIDEDLKYNINDEIVLGLTNNIILPITDVYDSQWERHNILKTTVSKEVLKEIESLCENIAKNES